MPSRSTSTKRSGCLGLRRRGPGPTRRRPTTSGASPSGPVATAPRVTTTSFSSSAGRRPAIPAPWPAPSRRSAGRRRHVGVGLRRDGHLRQRPGVGCATAAERTQSSTYSEVERRVARGGKLLGGDRAQQQRADRGDRCTALVRRGRPTPCPGRPARCAPGAAVAPSADSDTSVQLNGSVQRRRRRTRRRRWRAARRPAARGAARSRRRPSGPARAAPPRRTPARRTATPRADPGTPARSRSRTRPGRGRTRSGRRVPHRPAATTRPAERRSAESRTASRWRAGSTAASSCRRRSSGWE